MSRKMDRLEFLKETHRMLDREISKAYNTHVPDHTMKDLKKKKLELKDQIEKLERGIENEVRPS